MRTVRLRSRLLLAIGACALALLSLSMVLMRHPVSDGRREAVVAGHLLGSDDRRSGLSSFDRAVGRKNGDRKAPVNSLGAKLPSDRRHINEPFEPNSDSHRNPKHANFPDKSPGSDNKPKKYDDFDLNFQDKQVAVNDKTDGDYKLQKLSPGMDLDVKKKSGRTSGYPIIRDGKFIPGNRIVHFDLKGAAPKPDYIIEMFKYIKTLGGTGVLLEWEDMFPFEGKLAEVRHANAYTKEQIREILSAAQKEGLDIIPLVQTFGHLEYILKFETFAKYRQLERYPQVICLGDKDAVSIVKEAVSQVLAIHKEFKMPYFHMGADEAFQIGMCAADLKLMTDEMQSRERLMLWHIAEMAKFIRAASPKGTKVLMWHDMLNNVDDQIIKEFKLGEYAEPVVWNYAENLDDQLWPDMWQRFGKLFPNMWAASSFKGADGPSRFYSNPSHYVKNHVSWVNHMTRAYTEFTGEFRGIILTGWQRFDHMAVLCEIWPVGVPSMAVNLLVVQHGGLERKVLKEAGQLLDCQGSLDIDSPGVAGFCKFPGFAVYEQVQRLHMALISIEENIDNDYQIHGWLSRYAMTHNYSNAWYLDQVTDKISMLLADLRQIEDGLRQAMPSVFQDPTTTDEFIFEYLEPHVERLNKLLTAAQRISQMKTFPRRPFKILLNKSTVPPVVLGNNDGRPLLR